MAEIVGSSKSFDKEMETIGKEFRRLLFDEKNWILEKDEKGCKIYSVMTENSTKSRCFKCECEIGMAPSRTLDTIHPFGPYRSKYDENFVSSQVIHELGPNAVIGHYVGRTHILGIGFTGDYINSFIFDKTPEYHYSIYGSVHCENANVKSAGIRGWLHPSGFAAFKTENPDVTAATILWHSEFQALPAFLVKSVIERASVAGMIQYIQNLRAMKDQPFAPLTNQVPMCRNRVND